MNYCKWCYGEIWGYEESCPHCKRNLQTGEIDPSNVGFSSSDFFNSTGQNAGNPMQRAETNRQMGYSPSGGMPNQQMGYPPGGMPNQQMGYPPGGMPNQGMGYPPGGGIPNQQMGYPPGGMPNQRMGYPPGGMPNQQMGHLPRRKKKKIWIPILLILLVVLGLGTVGVLGYTGVLPIPFLQKAEVEKKDEPVPQVDVVQEEEFSQEDQQPPQPQPEPEQQQPSDQQQNPQTKDTAAQSEELYFYYSTLSPEAQVIYEKAVQEIDQGNLSIKIDNHITYEEANKVVNAVYYDRSDLFWLSGGSVIHTQSNGSEDIAVQIDFEGNGLEQDLQNNRARFESAVDLLLDGLEGLSAVELEKEIHDRVVKSVEYVTESEYNQSAYSSIVNKQTVCAGYARAMQYLLTRLGIPCYYCCGEGNGTNAWESHAWNILKLGDQYYNLDSCWDDPIEGEYSAYYLYYNLTDEQMFKDHRREPEAEILPHCTSEEYSFEAIYGIPRPLGILKEAGAENAPIFYSVQEYKDGLYQFAVNHGYGENQFVYIVYGEDVYQGITTMGQERWDVVDQALMDCGIGSSGPGTKTQWLAKDLSEGYYLITETITINP